MPFILIGIIIIHLTSLHITGSNKPLGINPSTDKTSFHPFFLSKDIITILALILVILVISMFNTFILRDPENFNIANPLNTPIHIQPEWYFLFAYSILRSIPNKLGGVVRLILSILMILSLTTFKKNKITKKFKPIFKYIF